MELGGSTGEIQTRIAAHHVAVMDLARVVPEASALQTAARAERVAWSDDELLRRMFQYEEMAWDEFIRRFRPLILGCIERVTRPFHAIVSRADREDVYSQLLYSLQAREMHRLRAYRSDRGVLLSTWIGVITRNVALDFLRRVPRRGQAEALSLHVDSAHGVTEDPEQVLERKQSWQQTAAIMEQLSQRDRDFVEMLYVTKLDPAAIAAALGISVKTVYSKKHKLHARLQQLNFQRG